MHGGGGRTARAALNVASVARQSRSRIPLACMSTASRAHGRLGLQQTRTPKPTAMCTVGVRGAQPPCVCPLTVYKQKKLEHFECMGTAGGRHAAWGYAGAALAR